MSGETQSSIWPLPKFTFQVTGLADVATVSFQEVSGLETETQTIQYRQGNSPQFTPIKMPGLPKGGNVTMRKGVFANTPNLWTWFDSVTMNTIQRATVVVNLLDESGKPSMSWTLSNAFPTKITGTDLKSDGNEVAVESLEVAYETLIVSAAS